MHEEHTQQNTISGGATVATIAAVEIRLLTFFSVDIGTFQVIITRVQDRAENSQLIFRNTRKITLSLSRNTTFLIVAH